jgi:hypothetical protein
MNNRERRIAKLAQALIDENLVDDEPSSDDFQSVYVSSCSSDKTISEINEDLL